MSNSSNEFVVNLVAMLQQQKSRVQVNKDIRELEKVINKIKLVGVLTKGKTKTEINQTVRELEAQLRHVRLQARIDNRQLNREINNALRNVSARDIQLNVSGNSERLGAQVRRAVSQAREIAERSPISVNIDLKREKLLNQLTAFLNKNTKINESSYWLGEAERLRGVIGSVTNRDELRNAADQLQVFTSGVRATGFAAVSTSDRIKNMLGNVLKIGNYFGLAFTAVNKFRQSLSSLKDLDTLLTEISKTSEMTARQLEELGERSYGIASRYGVLANDFMKSFQEMSRAGFGEDKAQSLAELATLAQSAGDLTAELANEYLIASNAAYGYSGNVEQLNALLDAQNQVTNRNAVSMTELADATKVAANQLANSNISENEMTALLGTGIATTKESGQVVGRAVKAIVMNLQQVQNTEEGLETTAEDLGKVESRLDSLGIKMEETADGITRLRNPISILSELAEVYNSLPKDSAERANIIADIGGKYRGNVLSGILSNWDTYIKMLGDYEDAAGSALQEAEKSADSWEGRLAQLQNSWDSLVASLTDKDAVKGGIAFLDNTVQAFEKLVDVFDAIPVLLTTVNASMAALNKNYGITQLINPETKKVDIRGNIMGFDISAYRDQVKHFRDASVAIGEWNDELSDGAADINDFNNATVQNNEQLKAYLQTTSVDAPASLNGYKAHLNAAGVSTDALRMKTVLLNTAVSMGVGKLVQLAMKGVSLLVQKMGDLAKAEKKESDAAAELYQKSKKKINSNREEMKSLDELTKKYGELKSKSVMDSDTREEIKGIQYDIVDLVGSEAKTLDLVNGKLDEQMSKLKSISEEKSRQNVEDARDAYDNAKYLSEVMVGGADDYGNDVSVKWSTDGTQMRKAEGFEHFTYDDFIHLLQENGYGDIFRKNYDDTMFNMRFVVDTKDIGGLEAKVARLEELKDFLASNGLRSTGLYQGVNEAIGKYNEQKNNELDAANNLVDAVVDNLTVSDEKLKEIKVDSVEDFEEYRQKMIEAAKSDSDISDILADGMLSDEGLEIAVNSYMATAEQFSEWYSKWKDRMQGDSSQVEVTPTLSVTQTIDQLNTQLKPAFDSLKSAYQNIFADDSYNPDAVDIPMLDSIKSSIEEINKLEGVDINIDMDAFDTLATTLADVGTTEEQARQAFNDFATSIFYATNATDGMTDETKALLEQLLESLGIVNATEVAEYALAEAKAKDMLATYDVINAKEGEYAAILAEGAAAGISRQQLYSLMAAEIAFGNNDLSVEEKINKLKELATQYGDTASAALATAIANDLASGHTDVDSAVNDLMAQINAGVQRIDIDFGNVGGGKKSASKAGKEAADAFLESFEKELKELDDLKDRGKITEKQYLDALRRLYLKYFHDKEKYLKEYEKYEKQYLDGMKSLYESAFSYITKQIDRRIDTINDQKDAVVSALEAERDASLEEIELKKEQLENEQEIIDKKIKGKQEAIDAIEKEIDAMQEANKERKREIDLQKAKYDFERMLNQRTSSLYKDGQMVWQADTSGIRDAKQGVEDAQLEIEIGNKEKKISLINEEIGKLEKEKDLLQERIDLLDKEADNINKHYDDLIAKEEQRFDAMVKGLEEYKSQFEELTELLENAQMEATLMELGVSMDALLSGSQEEFEKLKTAYIGILADMSRGNDEVIGQLSRLAGVNAESVSYLESTKGAFDNLGAVTLEGLSNSVSDVKDSAAGLATSAGEASNAIGGIQESVSGASQSIAPLNTELEKLKKLTDEVVTLLGSIKFPEIGDEGYVQKLRETAAAFGDIALKCAGFSQIDFSAVIGTATPMGNGEGNAMPEGDMGTAGTGFMGLASAISDAVTTIQGQMEILRQALDIGNTSFDDQIKKITEEYLPAWEELQARLAGIIGVGGGDGDDSGKKAGNRKPVRNSGGSESGGNGGSIIDIMQTGGEEVASKLNDPWLKAFNDFATDGDSSIQSICRKIVEMVSKMGDSIQEQCAAAANALRALSETIETSGIPSVGVSVSGSTVSGNAVPAHAKGTVGKAYAKGTGGYKGLPHDEKNALRSEYGQPELTVYPDGKAELTTEPTMGNLPKGMVIFNEEQTSDIIKRKGEVVRTYENGNVKLSDGTIVRPNGEVLRPLTPNDSTYQMIEKFKEYFNENRDAFVKPANAMNNAAEAMQTVVETINNNNTMNRNEVNIGDIHLHEVQDVHHLSQELLLRFPNMLLQEKKRL